MKICKCLCAAIALGVIACYANNAYASEPNLSLKEKVALRMASAPEGKVTLRKASASGKYAQGADVTFFGLNDDSKEMGNDSEERLRKFEADEKRIDKNQKKLNYEIDSRDSFDPNANSIKWWTPTRLKKDGSYSGNDGRKSGSDSGNGGQKTGSDNGNGGQKTGSDNGYGGWIIGWDPICCCCCCSCQPLIYPYVIGATDCGCGSYETGCDAGCYDFGCGYIDDYPCSYECDETCGSARPCRVRSTISRVISRVGAWR